MDRIEMNFVEAEATELRRDEQSSELSDLQLALVGGGSGDVVFH